MKHGIYKNPTLVEETLISYVDFIWTTLAGCSSKIGSTPGALDVR